MLRACIVAVNRTGEIISNLLLDIPVWRKNEKLVEIQETQKDQSCYICRFNASFMLTLFHAFIK
jgi:hypothetical protein